MGVLYIYYILYYNIIYNIYIILPFFALHTDNENANGTMVQWYKNFEGGRLWISDNKASLLEIETGRDAPDR